MKILHVLDHSIPLHSGYTFRTRAILEQQRALGWETVHLTGSKHKGGELLEEEVDGLSFYRTPQPSGLAARLPVFNQMAVIDSLAKRLNEVVEREKPDILHAHSPALNGVAALRVGRRQHIPVVYECRAFWEDAAVDHGTSTEWGLRYRLTRAMESYVFRHADAITTICEGLRGEIIGRGIPAEKITVIPNAVDIERFANRGLRDKQLTEHLGLKDKVVLGFIGSFYAYEGLSLLVRALPSILAESPATRLLLVGGGPQAQPLITLVAKLGLGDKVIFTGRVPHDQVNRYYDLVDIFVYPRESMRLTDLVTPLKPLEAMAQEKLVLASDVGGHKELIRDGDNGRLFAAGSQEALATAVIDMLLHREDWPDMKQRGRAFVEQERNWTASVARYSDLYHRLASARHVPSLTGRGRG